jgi:hypothetical protein
MRFGAFAILMFSISLVLYLMGYGPMVTVFGEQGETPLSLNCPNGEVSCTDTNSVLGSFINVIVTGGAAVGIGLLVAFISGYSATYVIPILIIIAALQFFVFPLNFLMSEGIPDIIAIPALFFFNILTVLAALHFVRGGV